MRKTRNDVEQRLGIPDPIGKRAWEKIGNRKEPVRGVYMNFLRYKKPPIDPKWKWHPTPATPATTLIRALLGSKLVSRMII